MLTLLFTLIVMSKLNSAKKKQQKKAQRQAQNEGRGTRVHKTTKLGSRFGAAKDAEAGKV